MRTMDQKKKAGGERGVLMGKTSPQLEAFRGGFGERRRDNGDFGRGREDKDFGRGKEREKNKLYEIKIFRVVYLVKLCC